MNMNPTKTNQPRLPKGRAAWSYAESFNEGPTVFGKRLPGAIPIVLLPCRTAREAKAIVKLHDKKASYDAIMAAVNEHSDGSLHPITNPITLTFAIQRALKLISK
jgi:hypothetical protein